MSRPDPDSGFTLIEVLIALVILVAGLVALDQAFGGGIRASQGANRDGQAVYLVENLLAELGRSRPLRLGTFEGRDSEGQHWILKVEAVSTGAVERETRLVATYAVSLDVYAPDSLTPPLGFQTILVSAEIVP